ncbi:PrsW family intramembrane metalloprotease [Patescibacteria group bacterium]|nr:PrsW family intramembrane metalloprotease [Patescibacteria group bacterium]
MKIIICIILASIPSLIWLAFYLRKDKHPEPNKMIIKIFILGIIAVPIAGFLEQGIFMSLEKINLLEKIGLIVILFAFVEELLKYLVIKFGILRNSAFDEPVDAMMYMIIAALGFAAAENIYLLMQVFPTDLPMLQALEFMTTRFLGATFLHALASAILGYFLAASLLIDSKIRKLLTFGGIICATILHSVFNYIIILNSQTFISIAERNIYLLVLLVTMAVIVSFMFKKIKKHRSICEI